MPLPALLLLSLLIGFCAGLRSMIPIAMIAWGQRFGFLTNQHWLIGWISTTPSLVLFTLAAIGELVADKLPKTPSRLNRASLLFRAFVGAMAGTVLSLTAGKPVIMGAIPGIVGALLGSYAGYHVRHKLTVNNRKRAVPVALAEDCIAFALSLFTVTRF